MTKEKEAKRATRLVREMIFLKSSGPGGSERAMEAIEREHKISFWQLDHLRKGKAKTVRVSLMVQLQQAYLAVCEQQLRRIEERIKVEKATQKNADYDDLVAEVADLASRLQAWKDALR